MTDKHRDHDQMEKGMPPDRSDQESGRPLQLDRDKEHQKPPEKERTGSSGGHRPGAGRETPAPSR